MKTQMTTFRKNILRVVLFIALIITNSAKAQTIKLSADQAHSNVGFYISMAQGLTRITGKYTDFDITINYVDSDMTKSSFEASIKAASLNTGIAGRDAHLATPDFFDTLKFPLVTFKSDTIVKNGTGYLAKGIFSMHGISKRIVLPFSIVGKSADGSIGFESRCTISRRDFQIGKDTLKPGKGDGFLSEDVMVEIDFLAKPPRKEK